MGDALTMALTINGQRVSPSRLEAEVARLRADPALAPRLRAMAPAAVVRVAQDRLINQVLLAQEAQRRIPEVPPGEVKARYRELVARVGGEAAFKRLRRLTPADVARIKRDLAEDLRLQKYMQRLAAELPPPTEEELFAAYMREPGRWQQPERVHAQHILKRRQPDLSAAAARAALTAVRAQAVAGADFAALARQFSDAPEQTDLGFFARGQLVPTFAEAVFQLAPGQVSDVIETEFGWHLAKVIARQAATLQSFAAVKDQIRAQWQEQQQGAALEARLAQWRAAATIRDT